MSLKRKIILAITGASGSLYANLLLAELSKFRDSLAEVGVIFSSQAREIWKYEMEAPFVVQPPFREYEKHDFNAPFASGSSSFDTLIVCPCSMGVLGRIAAGISDDLITRAADVMLKERRKLILVPRETPYNLIHIENMRKITLAGGIVCPASPSFYSKPISLEDAARTVIHRIIELAGFHTEMFRWKEE